jgi:hypothetical protein
VVALGWRSLGLGEHLFFTDISAFSLLLYCKNAMLRSGSMNLNYIEEFSGRNYILLSESTYSIPISGRKGGKVGLMKKVSWSRLKEGSHQHNPQFTCLTLIILYFLLPLLMLNNNA